MTCWLSMLDVSIVDPDRHKAANNTALGAIRGVWLVTCRQATFGVQWPKGSQKRLTAEFVDEEEAVSHINGTYLTKPVADTSEPATVARSSQGVAARLSVGNQEKVYIDVILASPPSCNL